MLAKAFWEDRSGPKVVKYSPGDEIPDDHPKHDWLLRSGIAGHAEPKVAPQRETEVVEDAQPVQEVAPEVETSGKPKPTDSIDKQRAYAVKVGIDPKNLSRAQLIKAIKDK